MCNVLPIPSGVSICCVFIRVAVALKVVQTWLGHAKVTTTADIYSHVTAQYFQKEAQKLTFMFCTPTRTPIIETKDTPEE